MSEPEISEELDGQLAMAATGGLSRDEQVRVAGLLRESATLRARYGEYCAALTATMVASMTTTPAPERLTERLRTSIHSAGLMPARAATGEPIGRAGFVQWLSSFFNQPARMLIPLALVLALGLGLLNITLGNQLAGQQAILAASAARLATFNLILASPQLINVALTGSSGIAGRLLCAPRLPGVLALTGFQATNGHRYEIDLIRKLDSSIDVMGTFSADPDGTTQQVFTAPVPWAMYASIRVVDLSATTIVAEGKFG